MGIIDVPAVLRKKLGDPATAGLIQLLEKTQSEREERLLYVFEDRLALRIKESEEKLRGELHQGFLNVERRFGEMNAKFEAKFAGLERQLTTQTRWLVTVMAALGLVLGVLDYLFR